MAQPKNLICRVRTLISIATMAAIALIAMAGHDSKTLMYQFSPKVWKRFRNDAFVV